MESDDPKDLILLVEGLRKENSVLRKRSQPGDSKHSFYENTELDEQEGIRDSEVDTINELEARITTLQRIVAQNREKLVEFEVVKRRLVALDSTMHTQRVLLERLTTENNSLRNTSAELRAENANLLEMYELELRRADLIRDLCIDLDEENKELHLSFQQSAICAYYGCEKRKLREDGTHDDGLLFPCQLPELSGDLVAYSRSSRIQSMDVVPHGTDVVFNCLNLGRALKIGAGEARCLNGNWTSPPPVCAIPDRSTLQGIVFDFDFRYRFGPTGVVYVEPKSEVIIKCISPTKLMPTLNYTVYDELSPVFIIKAEAEDSSAVARVFTFNTGPKFDAEFFCTTNETNAVFETRSVRIVTREARCGSFETREGLLYRVEDDMAVFRCEEPGRLLGRSTLHCVNGDWDHAQPMCVYQERCAGWLEDASNVTEDAGGFRRNENMTYVVREKQVLQENVTNYQLNQQLDSPIPTVRPPPRPLVAAIEEDDDESADETDDELKKIVEEAEKEDNEVENSDDPDDEEYPARPKRPLNPVESTPAPPQEPLSCPKPSGMFAYPQDCRRFIHCVEGVAKVMLCPQKLIFSPSWQLCREKDDESGCYADD